MRVYGYIRVSSKDQNEGRQVKKMIDKGVEAKRIFTDKASGKDFNRPQYQMLRNVLDEGDLLYIDALDRLGRNYDEVINEWKYITRELKADIVILENETLFDSRKFRDMGDIGALMEDQFLSLLSYVADQERKKIRQRQAEGIAIARAEGRKLGRPAAGYDELSAEQKRLFAVTYPEWKAGRITAVGFMSELDVKKTTFYKIVKEYEESR